MAKQGFLKSVSGNTNKVILNFLWLSWSLKLILGSKCKKIIDWPPKPILGPEIEGDTNDKNQLLSQFFSKSKDVDKDIFLSLDYLDNCD